MNKTAFLLIIVMATLVLFAGCTSGGRTPQGSDTGGTQEAETDSAPASGGSSTQVEVSQTVSGSENVAEQIQICEGMAEWSRTNCLVSLALNYEIPSLCYGDYYASCFTQMAIKYNKPQYCQMIDNPMEESYSQHRRAECLALFE